jgi:hypothetical protein
MELLLSARNYFKDLIRRAQCSQIIFEGIQSCDSLVEDSGGVMTGVLVISGAVVVERPVVDLSPVLLAGAVVGRGVFIGVVRFLFQRVAVFDIGSDRVVAVVLAPLEAADGVVGLLNGHSGTLVAIGAVVSVLVGVLIVAAVRVRAILVTVVVARLLLGVGAVANDRGLIA